MRFLALIVWILAFAAQPAAAATSAKLIPLEQQIATLLASKSGDYGVAALDLDSGEAVSVNGDRAFPMASTVKVAVAAAYLAQTDLGRRSLDTRIGSRSARAVDRCDADPQRQWGDRPADPKPWRTVDGADLA